ncbi:MAG: Glu-tRNA(Gln) amidotransferase GatDE subunit D [Methanobacteriota archaeon]|nr:MAG: Glu-tRNA(Gln) amidotransferase GatDE subunit D [Euryarchaeota archaeon]
METYTGAAKKLLEEANAREGDLIRVIHKSQTFEGRLMPRSTYGDALHIVIKLNNGYNIGLHVEKIKGIERIGPAPPPPTHIEKEKTFSSDLPVVTIVGTGGTIASRVDYRTGAVYPAISPHEIIESAPKIAEYANIKVIELFDIFSEDISAKEWKKIGETVLNEFIGGVDGVVIAHGTDTLGYTAAALSFHLQNLPGPVVLVGAQRSSDRPSSDAATNLQAAVLVAAKANLRGVYVTMHEGMDDTSCTILKGFNVRKMHTSRRDAFKSINQPPAGRVTVDGRIELATPAPKRNPELRPKLVGSFSEKACLIKFFPGMDPWIVEEAVNRGVEGIVIEGTGLGHVSQKIVQTIGKTIREGVLVAMASQCIYGRTNLHVYATGRQLLAAGVIPCGAMIPETALVKMMWALSFGRDEAEKLMRRNVLGEMPENSWITHSSPTSGGLRFG